MNTTEPTTPVDAGSGAIGPDHGLRVVVVCHYYPPHVGGIEQVAQNQAELLAAAGHHVEVVTTAVGGRPGAEQVRPGLTVHRVPTLNAVERLTRVPFPVIGWRGVRTIRRAVAGSDVVHIHDLFYVTSWIAGLWAVLLGRQLVLTQHVHVIEHPSSVVMAAQRIVYAVSGRVLLPRVDRISYLNATVAHFLRRLGARPDRMLFLPNLVDTVVFRPASGPDERTLLRSRFGLPDDRVIGVFVGRFVPKKGYALVAASSMPDFDLVLVGGPAQPGATAGPVTWFGSLPHEEVAELYRACDFFVLPSVSEGFPLTVGEAMSSGLPVITTDDPGYAVYELDRALVRLVSPTSTDVRSAVIDVARDPDLRRRMGAYSRAFAESRFDPQAHLQGLLDLYASSAGGEPPHQPRRRSGAEPRNTVQVAS